MDIDELIARGEELKSVNYESPKVELWKNDVKEVVVAYGEPTMDILRKAMFFGRVIQSDEDGQRMHIESIVNIEVLLRELKKRDQSRMQAQSYIINQKKEEARATLNSKLNSTTYNILAPTSFGNNSPANNIQVGELMLAIMSQAEDVLKDSPDKNSIITALKSVITNPTFASIAGASLPEIIKLFTKLK